MKSKRTWSMRVLVLSGVLGCSGGSRSHTLPWDADETRIIQDDGSVKEVSTPVGDGCLEETGICIRPQEVCGTNAADVVVDAQGRPIETVCYPPVATLSVEQLDRQDGAIAQNQNGSVLVLDAADDGVDVMGDVAVDANNVVIYGDSPDHALIAGDVEVDGNNIIVRGVHIQGDAVIEANNAVFLHCVIEGDVTMHGNNARLSACDVFGKVTIHGNNSRVTGNHIVGGISNEGKNSVCDANVSAKDANGDGALQSSELGAPLSC